MPRIGSKAALIAYMKKRVGKVLEADDLQAAANGAQQWSRRLRELRAEGWLISSHNDRVDLKPGQYVLEADAPTAGKHTLERPYRRPRGPRCSMMMGPFVVFAAPFPVTLTKADPAVPLSCR